MKTKIIAILTLSAVLLAGCGAAKEEAGGKETAAAKAVETAAAEDTKAAEEEPAATEGPAETAAEETSEAEAAEPAAAGQGYESPEALMADYYEMLKSKLSVEDMFYFCIIGQELEAVGESVEKTDKIDEETKSRALAWKTKAAELADEAAEKLFIPDTLKEGTEPDKAYLQEAAEEQIKNIYILALKSDDIGVNDITEDLEKLDDDMDFHIKQYKREHSDEDADDIQIVANEAEYYISEYNELFTKLLDGTTELLKATLGEGVDISDLKSNLSVPSINGVEDLRAFDSPGFFAEGSDDVKVYLFKKGDAVPMVCYEGRWYIAAGY